jgi:hypothetical protein
MAYRSGYRSGYRRGGGDQRGTLVTPRQAAALDRMAAAYGFANGSVLLADVASCTVAELGRKSRPVVQMFVDQAFSRYGQTGRTRGRCEDAPCCGCCD